MARRLKLSEATKTVASSPRCKEASDRHLLCVCPMTTTQLLSCQHKPMYLGDLKMARQALPITVAIRALLVKNPDVMYDEAHQQLQNQNFQLAPKPTNYLNAEVNAFEVENTGKSLPEVNKKHDENVVKMAVELSKIMKEHNFDLKNAEQAKEMRTMLFKNLEMETRTGNAVFRELIVREMHSRKLFEEERSHFGVTKFHYKAKLAELSDKPQSPKTTKAVAAIKAGVAVATEPETLKGPKAKHRKTETTVATSTLTEIEALQMVESSGGMAEVAKKIAMLQAEANAKMEEANGLQAELNKVEQLLNRLNSTKAA